MMELKNSTSYQLQKLINPHLFLGDLIALLFQVSYGMNSYMNNIDKNDNSIKFNNLNIQRARKLLWTVLTDIPRHAALKELLILQGGSDCKKKVSFFNIKKMKC